jgi:hypothetical protein
MDRLGGHVNADTLRAIYRFADAAVYHAHETTAVAECKAGSAEWIQAQHDAREALVCMKLAKQTLLEELAKEIEVVTKEEPK